MTVIKHKTTSIWAACALLIYSVSTAPAVAEPKITSVDYCADQFVLALANPDQIIALSKDANSPFSFYAERAKGMTITRGSAEEILMYEPDITVRQWFGSLATDKLFERAGIKSTSIGFASTPEDNYRNLIAFSKKIGHAEQAQKFVHTRRNLLKKLHTSVPFDGKALYITPGGYSAGSGTVVNDIINMAGFTTTAGTYGQTGWAPLPLEAMVQTPPDVIITSFFDLTTVQSSWSASNYPFIRDLLADTPVIDVPSRYLSCSGLFAADAASFIRNEAEKLGISKRPSKTGAH